MTDIQDMIRTPELQMYAEQGPKGHDGLPRTLYVAGPMTGMPELNYPAFLAAAAELEAMDFAVENPAITNLGEGAHYTEYLRSGLAQLLRSGGVAVLEGWWNSGGARWEVQTASILGLPVRSVAEWVALKEALRCVHCGEPTTGGTYPTHLKNGYHNKNRCNPDLSGQPYGLEATPRGTA